MLQKSLTAINPASGHGAQGRELELIKLYKWALHKCVGKPYAHHAEDIASETVVQFLSRTATKIRWEYCFTDALYAVLEVRREYLGRNAKGHAIMGKRTFVDWENELK